MLPFLMSPIYRYNGKILRRAEFGGRIARALACCCVAGDCCPCTVFVDSLGTAQELSVIYTLGLSFKIRMTGAITGYCSMAPDVLKDGICAVWRLGSSACDEALVESCGLNLTDPFFYCPEGVAPEDWTLEAGMSNLGCNFVETGLPVLYSTVARKPTTITCDPELPFYAKFVFPLEDTAPGGCSSCADTQITFEIDGPY
jgi:hypothetical protein